MRLSGYDVPETALAFPLLTPPEVPTKEQKHSVGTSLCQITLMNPACSSCAINSLAVGSRPQPSVIAPHRSRRPEAMPLFRQKLVSNNRPPGLKNLRTCSRTLTRL